MIRFPRTLALAALTLLVTASFPASADDPGSVLAYQMTPGKTLRYKITADVKLAAPFLDSLTPVDLDASLVVMYLATPKTLTADGSADVDFQVESADVEIKKIPFPIPVEEIQKIMNQSVTFARNGSVKQTNGNGKLPFGVSIPGVDPKRLYALVFPIVFQPKPVKPGDKWTFQSELLGGQGSKPTFTATVMPAATGAQPGKTEVQEQFEMPVKQTVDAEKKPIQPGAQAYKSRNGRIWGSGKLTFDRSAGVFTKSDLTIQARIAEDLLGTPQSPDDPKHIDSRVDAHVLVELAPTPNPPASNPGEPAKAPRS